MNLCVYCASSNNIALEYMEAGTQLGREIALQGHSLVYGGGNIGLMGIVARAVHTEGGKVIGVIPQALYEREVAYTAADELIITQDMRDRKAKMDELADVFIALPGGFGTLEELIEVITARSIGFHQKPIYILNINGFYDPLLSLFAHFHAEGFAHSSYSQTYQVLPSISALFDQL
jgi:uncharacterized protein (TIGR00730 family)